MNALKDWNVLVSEDNTNWTQIDSKRGINEMTRGGIDYYVAVDSPVWAKYVKFLMPQTNHDGEWCMVLARVEVFGDVDQA